MIGAMASKTEKAKAGEKEIFSLAFYCSLASGDSPRMAAPHDGNAYPPSLRNVTRMLVVW